MDNDTAPPRLDYEAARRLALALIEVGNPFAEAAVNFMTALLMYGGEDDIDA
jgi:hypothetical protein